ncbi:MAG: hypothetical protein GXX85_14215 [Ignavibacteria bacterium]|jgi:hypothetical protein|nr:hypothetical protein [Ignavibacteria bacterium]
MLKNIKNKIEQRLYSATDAHKFFGGNIGINKIRTMFVTGEIPAWKEGNKYVTTERHLAFWLRKKSAEAEMFSEKIKKESENIFRVA